MDVVLAYLQPIGDEYYIENAKLWHLVNRAYIFWLICSLLMKMTRIENGKFVAIS